MEEVIKKTHVQIDERKLLKELRVSWPSKKTIDYSLAQQLERCGVRELRLDFDIQPVIDERGQEVDMAFTGDVEITLRCYAWGEMGKGVQNNDEEKTAEDRP